MPTDVCRVLVGFKEAHPDGSMPKVAEVVRIAPLVSNSPFDGSVLWDDMSVGYLEVKVAVLCYSRYFIGIDEGVQNFV